MAFPARKRSYQPQASSSGSKRRQFRERVQIKRRTVGAEPIEIHGVIHGPYAHVRTQ